MRLAFLSLLVPCLATAGGFQRLYAEEATATGFLQSNWNKYQENYHPSYVLDDDPKTAWVEGAEGDGVGEALTIPLSQLPSARAVRLVIFNGYQKSPGLLTANAAPRQLTVTVRGPNGKPSARQTLTLERKMGPQSFDLPVSGPVVDVVLTVDSVHPGSKYRDTCISDVQVFVDSAVPYNAGAEKAKREALLRWKKERLATAKYYASLPRTYPYASTGFAQEVDGHFIASRFTETQKGDETVGVPVPGFVPLLERLDQGEKYLAGVVAEQDRTLIRELQTLSAAKPSAEGSWYALSFKGRVVPPENLDLPPYVHTLLNLGDATFFEAKGPGVQKPRLPRGEEYGEADMRSNLRVLEGTTTDPRKVYFVNTHLIVDRGTTTVTTHVLATLEGGKLSHLVSMDRLEDDFFGPSTTVQVVLPSWSGDKVSGVRLTRLVDAEGNADNTGSELGINLYQSSYTAVPRS